MKIATLAIFVVVLLTIGLSTGCTAFVVKGSGNLDTQEYYFSDFTNIKVGSAFKVNISQSDSYSINITADDNLFNYILVSRRGSTLEIGYKGGNYTDTTQRAEITIPHLRSLEFSGATEGTVSGFTSRENLDIEVTDESYIYLTEISAADVTVYVARSSTVMGELNARDVECYLDCSSTVSLQGIASNIIVDASHESRVKLGALEVENASVTLSCESRGAVNPYGRLDVDLSHKSSLGYVSDPTMGTMNISKDSILMAVGHVH